MEKKTATVAVGSRLCYIKTGSFTGGFHLVKTRKAYFGVLKDRVLEIYKSAKDEKSGKEPKFLFDLSTAFNVHLHFDALLKECISLMMPDETFLMRFDVDLNEWFMLLIDKSRQARATKLGRPVFREEYFEDAWDVEVVKVPKSKRRSKNDDPAVDLAVLHENEIIGKKRLCVYPHSVFIVKRGITATENVLPPLKSDEFTEFPMNAISMYGHLDKYFFFRAGRCAPTGAGEVWMFVDSGENAVSMSEKIIRICERESEKRRVQGSQLPSLSARTLRNQAHRERSHSHRMAEGSTSSKTSSVHKLLSPLSFPGCSGGEPVVELSDSESLKRDLKSSRSAKSIAQMCNADNADTGNLNFSRIWHPFVSDGSCDKIGKPAIKTALNNNVIVPSNVDDFARTPLVLDTDDCDQFSHACNIESEDMSSLNVDKMPETTVAESHSSATNLLGYTEMEFVPETSDKLISTSDLNYTLTEVRSYVSNSTESFESSNFVNRLILGQNARDDGGQRAFSCGSRPVGCSTITQTCLQHPITAPCIAAGEEIGGKALDDPRKRAHSLGSKTWIKPLRKISNVLSSDHNEGIELRQRSDSLGFGSGCRNGSFLIQNEGHKMGRFLYGDRPIEDLAEWDFRVTPMVRSGSSSLASTDGSFHSRTSSFCLSNTATSFRSVMEDTVKNQTDLNIDIQRAFSGKSLEEVGSKNSSNDTDDYIFLSHTHKENQGSDKSVGAASGSQRTIGTIMEHNASSGSSRSQSPKSFQTTEIAHRRVLAQNLNACHKADVEVDSASSSKGTPKSTLVSTAIDAKDAKVFNDCRTVDYVCLDIAAERVVMSPCQTNDVKSEEKTSSSNLNKCEYAIVEPYIF